MAFADPQSVTISGSATSLPRTGSGIKEGAFGSADGTITLKVSHQQSGKKIRSVIRMVKTKAVTDPSIPAQNIVVTSAPYLVYERTGVGLTQAEMIADIVGFLANLTASSNANLTKLTGQEN